MPTYMYACTACGEGLEAQQAFTDEALTECPRCEGRLRKVFGAVGVVFKGSGFYRTDSRAAASKAADNGSHNGTGDSSPGESKPAGKESKGSGSTTTDAPAASPAA